MYATKEISDLYYITVNGGLTALCTGFSDIRRTRIGRAPIQSPGIRVDPEETLVPALSVSLADRAPRVLVKVLAYHRLRNRVNHRGVRMPTRARADAWALVTRPLRSWRSAVHMMIG